MPTSLSPLERRLWLLTTTILVTVYLTLALVRPISNFLRERGLLRITMVTALLAIAVLLVVILHRTARRFPTARELGVLLPATVLYLAILSTMERAEEAFHFVEYGLVGGLIYGALLARQRRIELGGVGPLRPAWGPALWAMLLTAAAGALDEGIQKLLPTRYFDIRDIAFNTAAGILGVAVLSAWLAVQRPPLDEASDEAG